MVNDAKIKHMLIERVQSVKESNLNVRASYGRLHEFKIVDSFVYLVVTLSTENNKYKLYGRKIPRNLVKRKVIENLWNFIGNRK